MITAFPLTWPFNKPRTATVRRELSRFQTSLYDATCNVQRQVAALGGNRLVISTNLPVNRDGFPSSRFVTPDDPGVAVYFVLKQQPMCFACDRWELVGDNLHAIGKTIDALRGIERWGSGSMMSQAFTGFMSLPAPEQPWQVLGLKTSRPTYAEVTEAYRKLASQHHPDRPQGDEQHMARINAARDALYANFLIPDSE